MKRWPTLLMLAFAAPALWLVGCGEKAPATQKPAGPIVRGEKIGPVAEPKSPDQPKANHETDEPDLTSGVEPGVKPNTTATKNPDTPKTPDNADPKTVESIDTRDGKKKNEEDWPLADIVQPEDKVLPQAKVEGYESVSLKSLADFEFSIKDDDAKIITGPDPLDKQIPDKIKKLNGKKIATTGFMFPVDFKNGKTNKFMMIRVIPSCFYCRKPSFNEWVVSSTADGKRIEYLGDQLMQVTGKLVVGTERDEDGYVMSVYRLEVDGIKPFETE